MDAGSYLSAVIDIAIGVAGFAGIVAAIRQRRLSTWPAEQLILLQILFTASAAAIAFGLLPSFLVEVGIAEHLVWKTGSVAIFCWIVGAVWFRARQSRKHGVRQQIPKYILVFGSIALVLQIYNIAVLGEAWPYLFGITIILVNGFSVFLILVLAPTDD